MPLKVKGNYPLVKRLFPTCCVHISIPVEGHSFSFASRAIHHHRLLDLVSGGVSSGGRAEAAHDIDELARSKRIEDARVRGGKPAMRGIACARSQVSPRQAEA